MYLKAKNIVLYLLISLVFVNCTFFSNNTEKKDSEISIISWNLQTFFDSITHGTEYSEFLGSKSTWTKEKYQERLENLCNFIEKQDADIYAFTELENMSILQDISNNLKNNSIRGSKYKYACFGKNENGVFGCGIISKYPLENLKLHNVVFKQEQNQPELRPIVEVTASTKSNEKFSLFVCHWKSKSGGEQESEIWRDLQEKLLSSIIEKTENKNVVICGDFNRDLEEFDILDEENLIQFKTFNEDSNIGIKMKNPWLSSQEKGSYNFNGAWNKIDHFFVSEDIKIQNFQTIEEFTNEKGFPIKYSVRTGTGYSDHLPIMCNLNF